MGPLTYLLLDHIFPLLQCLVVFQRIWIVIWIGITGLALSKPNRLSLNRFGSLQTLIKPAPKPV